jgi:hypothetical protein
MTVTIEPSPVEALDAGVIEEARKRQRRHRGRAGTATVLVAAIAAVVVGLVAGGGNDGTPGSHASGAQPAAPITTAACITAPSSRNTGTPTPGFLALLGVLRQPDTSADSLPAQIESTLNGEDVYVNYIRRAQVIGSRSFFVVPVGFGCDSTTPSQGVLLACIQRANQHITDADVGSDSTAAQVRASGMFLAGGSCLHTTKATLIAGIVPDPVTSVTLRYPSVTITAAVVNNVIVASVPHPGSPLWHPISMTWRAANSHVIKTFNRL